MLEKLPEVVGHVLRDRRAGLDKLVFNRSGLRVGQSMIQLSSLAFADHAFPSGIRPMAKVFRRRWRGKAYRATQPAWC